MKLARWFQSIGHGAMRVVVALLALVAPSVPARDAETANPVQAPPQQTLQDLVERQSASAFELYRDLLTLPNVASKPDDMLKVIEWLEREFDRRGFTTERLATPGSDLLLATRASPNAGRTVLIYLQADGQPVDPSRWFQNSPWTPTLKERRTGASSVDGNPQDWQVVPWERLSTGPVNPEWRIFARSASDSKGPVAQFCRPSRC